MSKRFLNCTNNGTTAVVLESDLQKLALAHQAGGDPHKLGVKVFTFCSERRMATEPEARYIFTGDYAFMRRLLEGHEVSEGSFFVPFSNHTEDGVHGEEARARELLWRTTTQEVVDIFLS